MNTRNKEQSLLFDLFKAFDLAGRSHRSDFFSEKTYFQSCPSFVRNMLPHDATIGEKMSLFSP